MLKLLFCHPEHWKFAGETTPFKISVYHFCMGPISNDSTAEAKVVTLICEVLSRVVTTCAGVQRRRPDVALKPSTPFGRWEQ